MFTIVASCKCSVSFISLNYCYLLSTDIVLSKYSYNNILLSTVVVLSKCSNNKPIIFNDHLLDKRHVSNYKSTSANRR